MDNRKKKGINAINQDFRKYDQVHKHQSYHLAEDINRDEFDEDYVIKTCDLSLWLYGDRASKTRFARELGSALEGIGFAVLTGHGVDTALYSVCQQRIAHLFENTTYEERMQFRYKRHGSVNEGYFPMKETTMIHPDLVEGWVFCRRAFNLESDPSFDARLYWPDLEYEVFLRQVVREHENLILPIMQSILTYLDVDPHLYDEKLTRTNFGFRLNYYPPIKEEDDRTGAGRMLGHEDVDLFTILPAQDVEGLQVLNRRNNKWIRLNPAQGSMILNTGDYMQRITNDRLPSTTHRVSKPANKSLHHKPRITFPMAVYLWEDEILEVLPGLGKPKYEPVSAIQFHTRTTSKYYGDDYAVG